MNFIESQIAIDFDQEILDIISIQQGENIKIIDNYVNPDLANKIIIASFISKRQVVFAMQKIIRRAKELQIKIIYQSAKRNIDAEWVCLKCQDTVVHLFQEEVRDYYKIDRFYLDQDSSEEINSVESCANSGINSIQQIDGEKVIYFDGQF